MASLLMANFNYGNYMAETLDRGLVPTWEAGEVLNCNDGSSDGSQAVIADDAQRNAYNQTVFKTAGGQRRAPGFASAQSCGEIVGCCPL
jgi:glycosyltransferase involved in cell wall biosynthesis